MKKIFLCLFTLSCFPAASGMEPVDLPGILPVALGNRRGAE